MIPDALSALLENPVMMVMATRDAALRPAIARALGCHLVEDGRAMDIFVSRAQWPDAVANCAPGAPIAFTFCRPSDYRTFQVKGAVVEIAAAAGPDADRAEAYRGAMAAELMALGVPPHQIEHWLRAGDVVRIRFLTHESFAQTPGPGAGARMGPEPA
ncbi:MAG TPA: hypothetical protein VEH84_09820 [Alphaproteobacteria bacterium]|nr:hypothetical protein [Alphaproteobacteria bacterium]